MTHPLTALLDDIDLLIFDADGVLYDSETVSNQAWVDALGERGVSLTLEEMMDLGIGKTEPATRAEVKRRYGLDLPDGFDVEIRARFDDLNRDGLKATEGVRDFIEALPPTLNRCICSNAIRQRSLYKLEITGLAHLFDPDAVFSGLDFDRPKPHPDMHHHALRQFGVAPDRALVIEDTVTGAQAAVAAGIPFAGYLGVAFRPERTAETMRDMGATLTFDRW